ncbi:adenylate/guanylate cyclase domain-containing protein [Edaphobacter modestus]|uniref:Adenylate/guanylate cyclase family protein n=1 Tax=Edaphobacter modestus TaxID=388466 RepID=A0A4Q7YQ84_9BACT|nr:adenylate/guanylate cyclase domain-containing protein [Edaphobacter modestus]RZU39304.1 adenylate/guanylate cyclase family protein [Edaphobacter modestus]
MSLKSELEEAVQGIFKSSWTIRDGTVVPDADTVKLTNDAVKLTGTVLYADMADSTKMVDHSTSQRSAESYKAFLHCAAKIIRGEGGTITAYDGDRIMAVFLGNSKNSDAVRAAMKIRFASRDIINPAKIAQYADDPYPVVQAIGIDTSSLFVANSGVRGAKDLVWVGRAANHAAKMAALPESYVYISADVYGRLNDRSKFSGGVDMWEARTWTAFDSRTIYRSSYYWKFD